MALSDNASRICVGERKLYRSMGIDSYPWVRSGGNPPHQSGGISVLTTSSVPGAGTTFRILLPVANVG